MFLAQHQSIQSCLLPIFPCLWMYPGMIPILHSPGLMIPGQLGPMILVTD